MRNQKVALEIKIFLELELRKQ